MSTSCTPLHSHVNLLSSQRLETNDLHVQWRHVNPCWRLFQARRKRPTGVLCGVLPLHVGAHQSNACNWTGHWGGSRAGNSWVHHRPDTCVREDQLQAQVTLLALAQSVFRVMWPVQFWVHVHCTAQTQSAVSSEREMLTYESRGFHLLVRQFVSQPANIVEMLRHLTDHQPTLRVLIISRSTTTTNLRRVLASIKQCGVR